MRYLSIAGYKSAVKRGHTPVDALLRKDMFSTVEAMAEDRRVRFTISTASPDRELDVVAVDGWQLDAFRQNPVVLWGHDSFELPIGRCVDIVVDGGALKAEVEFVPADMPCCGPRAEAVLRMCRTGFLSATSVGFRPLDMELASERMTDDDWWPPMNFLSNELLEFSIVSIPCNPEALIEPGERTTVVSTPPGGAPSQQELAAIAQETAEQLARVSRERTARRRRAGLILLS